MTRAGCRRAFREPDGWLMPITACTRDGSTDGHGVIGHARSRDLVTCDVLRPLTARVDDWFVLGCRGTEHGAFVGDVTDPFPSSGKADDPFAGSHHSSGRSFTSGRPHGTTTVDVVGAERFPARSTARTAEAKALVTEVPVTP